MCVLAKLASNMSEGSVRDAVTDLASASALLAAQERSGLPREECLVAMCQSWAQRLRLFTHLSDADKAALTDAITTAPFTPDQTQTLAKIVMLVGKDTRVARSTRTQNCMRVKARVPCWWRVRGCWGSIVPAKA